MADDQKPDPVKAYWTEVAQKAVWEAAKWIVKKLRRKP